MVASNPLHAHTATVGLVLAPEASGWITGNDFSVLSHHKHSLLAQQLMHTLPLPLGIYITNLHHY